MMAVCFLFGSVFILALEQKINFPILYFPENFKAHL